MRRGIRKWLATTAALALGIAAYALLGREDAGQGRFFADQTYHFQTLRLLNDVAADGADIEDVLETVKRIRSGDAQGWFRAWAETGDRAARLANATADRIAKGRALLRAHNYYRTAQFFLPPGDPKRPDAAAKDVGYFYAGLDVLRIAYERIKVPYGEGHHLEAVYFPAADSPRRGPLIVLGGGFDSTLEELYFILAKDAHDHGYDVLAYDGPGQGAVLREQGLTLTAEWEKPTTAVLDDFLARHRRPGKIVLVGTSLGGYLAPRAAAFDERIDGVVAYDVLFDMGAATERTVPRAFFWMRDDGMGFIVDAILRGAAARSPKGAWFTSNGTWTLGTNDLLDTIIAFRKYTLAGVAQRIKGDVLMLAGAEDHFIPVDQVAQLKSALTAARSVTTRIYDRQSGGAEHCQIGAETLWHADFFDWMAAKFGGE